MAEKILKFFSFNHEKYQCMLDDPNSRFGFYSDNIIFILVLFFPFILMFESIWDNSTVYWKEIYILDAIISMVFAAEYFYRFFETDNKVSFLTNPMRIIELLSFLPFFLGFIVIWNYLKILRILRVLRILRLFKHVPLTSWFIKALKEYSDEYKAVFTIYFIVLFILSCFVYYAEKWVVWTHFTSIPEALWWWLVTTTTVWYWDIILQTTLWKLIWSVLVFFWPILWWLISAVTIMVFMETNKEQELKKLRRRGNSCKRCETKNPFDANYCLSCWKKF